MNIKRGLFRLWLVLSVMFAVAVFFFSWESVKSEFAKQAVLDRIPKSADRLVPIGCWNKRGAAKVDYVTEDGTGESKPWERCWYTSAKIRLLYPEYKDFTNEFDLLKKTYMDANVPLYPAHPWRSLGGVAAFAAGVPAIIFIVGAAFVWAFSGFKRPHRD